MMLGRAWVGVIGIVLVATVGSGCAEDSRCELTATCPALDAGVHEGSDEPKLPAVDPDDNTMPTGGEPSKPTPVGTDEDPVAPSLSMLPTLPPGSEPGPADSTAASDADVLSPPDGGPDDVGTGESDAGQVQNDPLSDDETDPKDVDAGEPATGPTEVDACAVDHGGCDPLSECSSTPSGASCGACAEGYAGDGTTGCVPTLLALTLSHGSMTPELDPDLDVYDLVVPVFIEKLTLSPEVPQGASVTIRGAAVASGGSWTSPRLDLGLNTFTLSVEQAGQPSATYTLRVTRGAAATAYIKASNTGAGDSFGGGASGDSYVRTALSADGTTLAVGVPYEDSDSAGVGGDEGNGDAPYAGAVYVFERSATGWAQQAYVKASNTDVGDNFGWSVALSADGRTLGVGAHHEQSSATGTSGGGQSNNDASNAGAVYVFTRNGGGWSQQAYLKASNTDANDYFGTSLALSGDGNRLVVGAYGEASGTSGSQNNNDATYAGAAYVFERSGGAWRQQAYLKASNADDDDYFGWSVAMSSDGGTVAVGAYLEDSAAVGTSGAGQNNNDASAAGAVYVFAFGGGAWSQQAYVKASNTEGSDFFGNSVALSGDGSVLAVAARSESSSAPDVPGAGQNENGATIAGAGYVFARSPQGWIQEAFLKASNAGEFDNFGVSISLSTDGDTLAVGALSEDGSALAFSRAEDAGNDLPDSGAAYVFVRDGDIWSQHSYVKAENAEQSDYFGASVALSGDGSTLAVGAPGEDSNATGTGGSNQDNNEASFAGAVYVYR